MGIEWGISAAIIGWLFWRMLKARSDERSLALRRVEHTRRHDVFVDTWLFDFVEMAVLYSFHVTDGPTKSAPSLHQLRRSGVGKWETRISPDCATYTIAEIEKELSSLSNEPTRNAMSILDAEAKRDGFRRAQQEWRILEEPLAAQLESQFHLFSSGYAPVEPAVSLQELWRKLTRQQNEKAARHAARTYG
ncbi:hypothetical protein [Myxococcus sp. AB025B]|uniref:hypothetical protein n=1 Tax=Myxococcus sp. AB025B TaxID=2562794 RepID=UPI0011431C62|nr:hypothetical protein [Myxococcus sp. AB025B]